MAEPMHRTFELAGICLALLVLLCSGLVNCNKEEEPASEPPRDCGTADDLSLEQNDSGDAGRSVCGQAFDGSVDCPQVENAMFGALSSTCTADEQCRVIVDPTCDENEGAYAIAVSREDPALGCLKKVFAQLDCPRPACDWGNGEPYAICAGGTACRVEWRLDGGVPVD